jgi:hypothetical protein
MREAIGIPKYSTCRPNRLSWRARVWAWLCGSQDGRRIIPLGQRSLHLLRDIGLEEDVRANRLLADHTLFRR